MIMNALEEFSDSQAVTATAISTNVIDLYMGGITPNTLRDIGIGQPSAWLVVQVDVLPVSAGASTLVVTLESDSTVDLATSATVHYTSASFLKAALAAGTEFVRIPLPSGNYERYLGVRYTVGTADYSAGKFSAFITGSPQRNVFTLPGYTIG